MRLFPQLTVGILIAVTVGTTVSARAQNRVNWSTEFMKLDEAQSEKTLVVMVFTNDVSPEWLRASKAPRPKGTPICWCEAALAQAAGQIDPGFFHPSSPIFWQRIPIGLPPILTGGKPHSDVPRTFTILTDGEYRFLEMMVGVPEQADLSSLIEDAEETRMWMHQYCGDPTEATPIGMLEEIVDRNQDRLGRLWTAELGRQRRALGDDAFQMDFDGGTVDPLNDPVEFTELFLTRLGSIADQLQMVYLQDAQSRYGLTDESDIKRLAVLEQHSDTRQSWVSCLSPFAVGTDVRKTYVPLAELIWNCRVMPTKLATPHTDGSSADAALSAWIEGQGNQHPFALRLPLPFLASLKNDRRAAVSEVAERRGLGWDDLNAELQKLPVYQTSPLPLATRLHRTGARPIDLNRPSPTQVLFFRSAVDHANPIRDGEPPGRSVTMIRRVQR